MCTDRSGLLLIDVDFTGSKRAAVEAQTYSPFELGLGAVVDLENKGSWARRHCRS